MCHNRTSPIGLGAAFVLALSMACCSSRPPAPAESALAVPAEAVAGEAPDVAAVDEAPVRLAFISDHVLYVVRVAPDGALALEARVEGVEDFVWRDGGGLLVEHRDGALAWVEAATGALTPIAAPWGEVPPGLVLPPDARGDSAAALAVREGLEPSWYDAQDGAEAIELERRADGSVWAFRCVWQPQCALCECRSENTCEEALGVRLHPEPMLAAGPQRMPRPMAHETPWSPPELAGPDGVTIAQIEMSRDSAPHADGLQFATSWLECRGGDGGGASALPPPQSGFGQDMGAHIEGWSWWSTRPALLVATWQEDDYHCSGESYELTALYRACEAHEGPLGEFVGESPLVSGPGGLVLVRSWLRSWTGEVEACGRVPLERETPHEGFPQRGELWRDGMRLGSIDDVVPLAGGIDPHAAFAP